MLAAQEPVFSLWYGHRQGKGAQIYCFIGKVSQDTSSFFPRVGRESDKVIAFRSFERLAVTTRSLSRGAKHFILTSCSRYCDQGGNPLNVRSEFVSARECLNFAYDIKLFKATITKTTQTRFE